MIAYMKGTLLEKGEHSAVVEAGGIGYEIMLAPSALRRIGEPGRPVELHISESFGLYGGGATLYGFLSREEKEIFLCLRAHVPSTGAKKALEHLDKASRSLPDFRRAVLEGDCRILADVFGFTRKTAERLIASLKEKLGPLSKTGQPTLASSSAARLDEPGGRNVQKALDALVSLGYKASETRNALNSLIVETQRALSVEEMIRMALRRL